MFFYLTVASFLFPHSMALSYRIRRSSVGRGRGVRRRRWRCRPLRRGGGVQLDGNGDGGPAGGGAAQRSRSRRDDGGRRKRGAGGRGRRRAVDGGFGAGQSFS